MPWFKWGVKFQVFMGFELIVVSFDNSAQDVSIFFIMAKSKKEPKKAPLPSLLTALILCTIAVSAAYFSPTLPSIHSLAGIPAERAANKPYDNLTDFYPFYKSEHRNKIDRILHFWFAFV